MCFKLRESILAFKIGCVTFKPISEKKRPLKWEAVRKKNQKKIQQMEMMKFEFIIHIISAPNTEFPFF